MLRRQHIWLGAAASAGIIAAVSTLGGIQVVQPVEAKTAHPDPLTTKQMRGFLASQPGNVSIAVDNLQTGREYRYHHWEVNQTASVVKVDILATLLHDAQEQHRTLTAEEQELAAGMIEDSDDDDATDLYDEIGGAAGLAAFDKAAGLTQTTPNDAWGITTTTADDQIKLLRDIILPNRLLGSTERQYELGLMEHITPDQDWGVSAGIPAGVTIALKNGWVPIVAGDWQINSIGMIHGDGRYYLVAVLTNGDADEGTAIATIQGISTILWKELAP